MSEADVQISAEGLVLEQLIALDGKSRGLKSRIPATVIKQALWQGLVFILDGVRVISAMDEIRELLPYPSDLTVIPGTKGWMLGLANVRGELLPIVDLQYFVGGAPVVVSGQSRVLVIRNRGMSTGLLVSSVEGMRHLPELNRIPDAPFEGALGKYVYDVFGLEDAVWPVFSMAGLANDKRFAVAAA